MTPRQHAPHSHPLSYATRAEPGPTWSYVISSNRTAARALVFDGHNPDVQPVGRIPLPRAGALEPCDPHPLGAVPHVTHEEEQPPRQPLFPPLEGVSDGAGDELIGLGSVGPPQRHGRTLVHGNQIDIKTGLEFWFTPPMPGRQHPPPCKQFLLTPLAIFPLRLIVPRALQPFFQAVPVVGLPVVSHVAVSGVTVGLMTYVIMPHYTRWMAAWLYR